MTFGLFLAWAAVVGGVFLVMGLTGAAAESGRAAPCRRCRHQPNPQGTPHERELWARLKPDSSA